MAASVITFEVVQSSVFHYFSTNFVATGWILYPGGLMDTEDPSLFVAIHVDSLKSTVPGTINVRDAVVEVDCWAKLHANQARASEAADEAVKWLEQVAIPLKNFAAQGEPQVGTLFLDVLEIADRSPQDQVRKVTDLQHVRVTLSGKTSVP